MSMKGTSWATERKAIHCPPGYSAHLCKDCREVYILKDDVPLNQQMPNSYHTWAREDYYLRHRTRDDEEADLWDSAVCSVCGAAHSSNAETGCELSLESEEKVKP